MAVLKPRNRILVLRLSHEEYEALRKISLTRGARNLSDFTRSALLAVVAENDATGTESLAGIRRAISNLQDVVGRMSEKIDHVARQEVALREANKA